MTRLVLLSLFFSIGQVALARATKNRVAPAPKLASFEEFDHETAEFQTKTTSMQNQAECLPIYVTTKQNTDINYLYCSEVAKKSDAESRRITDDIIVPAGISHRFNFWRRVYSLWSKDQHVLHSAEYPEVVLEFWDVSRFNYDRYKEERVIRHLRDTRRKEYVRLLLELHRQRNVPVSELAPSLQRIAGLMAHIDQPNKYLLAAQSLRVQRGQREYIEGGLNVAPRYLPYIEQEFEKQGVPKVFAKLAFIESSFNLQARSKVGASGVYQIMPETGRQYLIVSDGIDERNDPIKASKASAKLLMLNYNLLGKWPLAITAYNHGVGGIRRAMNAERTDDIVKLIRNYDGANFGFASKNFYAGFLGLVATLENSRKIFPRLAYVEPIKFQTVRAGGMSIRDVKKKYKMTNRQIAEMNPDISYQFIRREGVLPGRYMLKVPAPQNPQLLSQK